MNNCNKEKIKIFIGTREVAGYFGYLKKGFTSLGYYCKFYDFYPHPFAYNLDDNKENKIVTKLARNIDLVEKNKIRGIKKLFITISTYFLSMIALIDSIVNFNVFIFPCNAGFWRIKPFDYFLIKTFGKKIIFISNGTDIRPPYLSGKFIKNNKNSILSIYARTKKLIKKIRKLEYYSDYIISYPAHSQLLKKNFLNCLTIGLPVDIDLLKEKNTIECENQNDISKINILHAPSDPLGKGTAKIREIIEDLKKKGYEINYVEITNQPHYKVIEAIKNCDFVIDQIYSDTPFPFFSIEAGLLSKPSVIGGYYKDFLKNDIKDAEFPDFLFVNPENLLSICEDLCKSKELRIEYGKKIQKFLIENWSYTEVCKKYIKIMEGDFPAIWWYDPENISYFYGYGINKDELKEFLRKYISTFGEKSLFLEHNKSLLDKINNINSVK